MVIEHPSAGKCLFFVAFSVDLAKQLPPSYWQSIQSLTNLDSTVMHGMRPFVAALTSRTKRTHASRPMHATASARFAMENGRAVLAVAIRDPNSVSIPIDQYIGATTSAPFVIVSDASPTGMCAALYHPATGAIAAWGGFKFPYNRDVRAQYQGNQEYLGNLFSLIVLIAHTPAIPPHDHTSRSTTIPARSNGPRHKMPINGQPLRQPRSNATPHSRAPANGTTGP